jgi:hypothetical protein
VKAAIDAAAVHEVGWAVLLSAAVLVSGVALRLLGGWLRRSLGRDFAAMVASVHKDDLSKLHGCIQAMRAEQVEQHGQVREDVLRLGVRLEAVDSRLDRIEHRVYPPAPPAPTPPGEPPHVHT